MSKSKGGLFSSKSRTAAVTMVEVSVARSFARRALFVFWGLVAAGVMVGVFVGVAAGGSQAIVAVVLGAGIGGVCGLVASVIVRLWPLLRVVWSWALELAVVSAVGLAWSALADAVSGLVALLLFLALAGGAALVAPVRRRLVAVAWCAIVRHRLRLCFAEFIRAPSRSGPGNVPLILFARPTPAGERVWVWLRPGLDLSDLEGRIPKLAVACWASQARVVHASKRFAALIRVDLARRDPLVTGVDSPLPGLVELPDDFEPHNLFDRGAIPTELDLADVPDPVAEAPERTRPERALRSVPRQRKAAAESSDDDYDAFI